MSKRALRTARRQAMRERAKDGAPIDLTKSGLHAGPRAFRRFGEAYVRACIARDRALDEMARRLLS